MFGGDDSSTNMGMGIGGALLIVLLCVGIWYWYTYMRAPFPMPAGSAALSDPGDCYVGVTGWQPNAGSNAGSATGAASASACAKICDSRTGCTGYKYHSGGCFPLQITMAEYSGNLAKADGWSSAIKRGTA